MMVTPRIVSATPSGRVPDQSHSAHSVSAADTDSKLAAVWAEMNAERLESISRHAHRLCEDGHLRAGISVDEARDVLWAYRSPELYDLLVQRRGWSVERFGAWMGEAHIAALL